MAERDKERARLKAEICWGTLVQYPWWPEALHSTWNTDIHGTWKTEHVTWISMERDGCIHSLGRTPDETGTASWSQPPSLSPFFLLQHNFQRLVCHLSRKTDTTDNTVSGALRMGPGGGNPTDSEGHMVPCVPPIDKTRPKKTVRIWIYLIRQGRHARHRRQWTHLWNRLSRVTG